MKKLYKSIHIVLVGVLVLSTTLMLPINLVGARPILQEIAPIDQPVIGDETPVEQPIIVPIEQPVIVPVVGEFTPLPEPTPSVGIIMSPVDVGSITLDAVTNIGGNTYRVNGTWQPTGNQCWIPQGGPNSGGDFHYRIRVINTTTNQQVSIIEPAPCNGNIVGPIALADRGIGGAWPAAGQTGGTFDLTSGGTPEICVILEHANPNGNDYAFDGQNCKTTPTSCTNPLDYIDDGDVAPNKHISLSDGTKFSDYYGTDNLLADLNHDGKVNHGDYKCAKPDISKGTYTCPFVCEAYTPRCGDKHVDTEIGEQCDGKAVDGNECDSECHIIYPEEVIGDSYSISAPAVISVDYSLSLPTVVETPIVSEPQQVLTGNAQIVVKPVAPVVVEPKLEVVEQVYQPSENLIVKVSPAPAKIKLAKTAVKIEDAVKPVVKPVAVVNTATAVQTPSIVEQIVTAIQSTLNKLMFWR